MREGKTLEYKENMNSNTFMKTISAYANYGDGEIIFGITDDGRVIGINDPVSACLDLENKINDAMNPVPEYSLDIQKDSTIVLSVYEGQYKPYLYKGKAYKRNDSSTVEVERLEYNRLILEGRNISFDESISIKQDLSFNRLEQEFKDTMGISELNTDILKTLELYSDKNGFNNAAALLADQNNFKGIDIIRFGDSIDEIMERKTIEGVSVLIQLNECIKMFQSYYQYEKIQDTQRKKIDKIPEKAFREAIANALVHRTWDVNASIKISMYPDKIEISSPGGLPVGISKEEYLNGQISIFRNPILENVFFRLKYIEKFGTGIMRINYAYKNTLENPQYKIYENSIKVILPVLTDGSTLTKPEKEIVTLLRKKEKMSRVEIDKTLGWGKDKTIRILNLLLKKNIIYKDGVGRGTSYYLIH